MYGDALDKMLENGFVEPGEIMFVPRTKCSEMTLC